MKFGPQRRQCTSLQRRQKQGGLALVAHVPIEGWALDGLYARQTPPATPSTQCPVASLVGQGGKRGCDGRNGEGGSAPYPDAPLQTSSTPITAQESDRDSCIRFGAIDVFATPDRAGSRTQRYATGGLLRDDATPLGSDPLEY